MDMVKVNAAFEKIKLIIEEELNLMDQLGYIINSTNSEKIGDYDLQFKNIELKSGIIENGEYIYYSIEDIEGHKYVISIKSKEKDSEKLIKIIGVFFAEDFDSISKEKFLKDLLLKRTEKDKLESFCEKFNINLKGKMQVMLINVDENILDDVESLISHIYPEELFTKISNTDLVLIKDDLDTAENSKEYELNIYDSIYSELFYEPKIGIGVLVEDIVNLCISFDKAKIAIKLGEIFFNDTNIYYYDDLGIHVLINNMGKEKLIELAKDMNYNVEKVLSDDELVITIIRFLENDLNISETAKKLFIHRNTLIYRLNKILKISGYDLRKFEDAMNFKIAMFVDNFLKS